MLRVKLNQNVLPEFKPPTVALSESAGHKIPFCSLCHLLVPSRYVDGSWREGEAEGGKREREREEPGGESGEDA